jgi:hypothetical protein
MAVDPREMSEDELLEYAHKGEAELGMNWSIEWFRSDPETYARYRAAFERRRQRRMNAIREGIGPVHEALKAAGVDAPPNASLWYVTRNHPESIGILIEHIGRQYDVEVKAAIAHGLQTKAARGIADRVLMDEFLNTKDEIYQGVVARALEQTATSDVTDDLIEVARDRSYDWRVRIIIAQALARCWRVPGVLDALQVLRSDAEIGSHVNRALRRYHKA